MGPLRQELVGKSSFLLGKKENAKEGNQGGYKVNARAVLGIAIILFVGALYLIAEPSNNVITETVGNTEIESGQTTKVVTHNLGKVPNSVLLTGKTDTQEKRFWVSNETATTFQINLDSAYGS